MAASLRFVLNRAPESSRQWQVTAKENFASQMQSFAAWS